LERRQIRRDNDVAAMPGKSTGTASSGKTKSAGTSGKSKAATKKNDTSAAKDAEKENKRSGLLELLDGYGSASDVDFPKKIAAKPKAEGSSESLATATKDPSEANKAVTKEGSSKSLATKKVSRKPATWQEWMEQRSEKKELEEMSTNTSPNFSARKAVLIEKGLKELKKRTDIPFRFSVFKAHKQLKWMLIPGSIEAARRLDDVTFEVKFIVGLSKLDGVVTSFDYVTHVVKLSFLVWLFTPGISDCSRKAPRAMTTGGKIFAILAITIILWTTWCLPACDPTPLVAWI